MAGIRESEDALVGCETGIVRVEHEVCGEADRDQYEPEYGQGYPETSATCCSRWSLICVERRNHGRDSSVAKPMYPLDDWT